MVANQARPKFYLLGTELLWKAKAIQMFLDFRGGHWPEVKTSLLRRDLFVCLFQQVFKAHTEQLITSVANKMNKIFIW